MTVKLLIHAVAIVVFFCTQVIAQERTITGQVSGEEEGPLPGVSILVKGTNEGAVTDINGNYSISVPEGADILVYSYVGYLSQEVSIGNRTSINIVMESDTKTLSEVVVTALGFEASKDKLGNATHTVQGDALARSGEPNLINSMQGKSPGVNIVQSSGDPGAGSRIQIRGATSITQNIQPLIVIDGVPIFNDSYYGEGFGGQDEGSSGSIGSGGGVTQQNRLNDLNPDDIASIEVLKGASAAAVWGSRAANGVLVITTKKGSSSKDRVTINFNSSVSFDEVNQEIPLNERYGQGSGMIYSPTNVLSFGDRIANRPGGDDTFITDENAPGYAGMFIGNTGKTYYAIAPGTENDLSGGKNSRAVFNPFDYLFETGVTWTNSISLGTSGDKGDVYLSLSHLDQDGIIKENSTYQRTTGRINANRYLGKLFTVKTSAGYTRTTSNRVQMGSNLSGLFLGGLRTPADFFSEDYEGTYIDPSGFEFPERQRAYRNYLGANTSSGYDNPLWMMRNITSKAVVNRFIGKLELGFDPLSWLNITARGGLDFYTDEREDFYPILSAGENSGGRFTKETITRSQLNLDLIARANFKLNDYINTNFLVGLGLNEQKLDDHGATTRQFTNPLSPPQLSNGTGGNRFLFNYEEVIRTIGYYATAGVELYDQVFVNLSGRVDALSSLPVSDNTFFYPAGDIAWQFTKILPQNSILTFGKLRAGYGKVGRGPDPYLLKTTFINPDNNTDGGFGEGWGPGVNPDAYGGGFAISNVAGNPDIKPETKIEFEVGADLRFINDRLTLGVTYYENETNDLIIQVDVPESSGFIKQTTNAADIENKGIELDLSGTILKNPDFSWVTNINYSHNRNEVLRMSGTNSVLISGFSGTSSRGVVGEQLGVLWGARWTRNDDGSLDLDENGFPQLGEEAGVIGDPNPDFRLGFGNTFTYKNLTVNILFDGSFGNKMWNGTKGALAFFGRAAYTAEETILTEAQANDLLVWDGSTVAEVYPYAQQGDGTYVVRGSIRDFGAGNVFLDEIWYTVGPGSGFTGPDEQFVEDAEWTRLREVTVSYNFNTPWVKDVLKLQNINFSFTGRNLKLWTDYTGVDPDTNLNGAGNNGFGLDYFNNPNTRSYIFTLRVTY
ncbi:SusC/RagA family TonB-linked outer membrane protein [Rapidithrix thailandica]|uniref:SusC/RagA family TonB-linked outer membrane protein n=1 Tax=Rapidithrix thailandica TaxID=413964 RepID=A0AAW9S2V4_9BACT